MLHWKIALVVASAVVTYSVLQILYWIVTYADSGHGGFE